MNKFQRGASVAIVVSIMAGVSFGLSTVVSFASDMNATSTSPLSVNKSKFTENGYNVIYQKSDGELTNEIFNSCQEPSNFILVDNNWRITHSGNFSKIICQ